MVSSTPRPQFTPGKDRVPILQEAGWAPGPVWTGGKPRPHLDSIPDRPARSQSLFRLLPSPKYIYIYIHTHTHIYIYTHTHVPAILLLEPPSELQSPSSCCVFFSPHLFPLNHDHVYQPYIINCQYISNLRYVFPFTNDKTSFISHVWDIRFTFEGYWR